MSQDDDRTSILKLVRREWPAVLAVLVLVGGHLYLTVVEGHQLTPLDVPLFLAIIVFITGELGRRLL